MYSVLIQNQKTIESFNEFHPLFLEALNNGEIGYCRWFEAGKTIDAALPGLKDLTADKKEWRAIIVRVADESSMRSFEADPQNPYDFKVNIERKGPISLEEYKEDSPIPLVRLTHMLGGIPSPELSFEKDVVEEEGMAPVMVFKPHHDSEKEKAYRELLKHYRFDGVPPTDIILITLSPAPDEDVKKETENYWSTKNEIRSSEFWKRNNYPGICRFMRYEYKQEGAVRKNADLFKFWSCVLLLAKNNVDPSSLQGYRLYKVGVEIDTEALFRIFQEKADRLAGCRLFIDNEIKRDVEKRLSGKSTAPIYAKEIEVPMEIPANTDVTVGVDAFGLCSKSENSELKTWNVLRGEAENTVTRIYKKADRALGESAERMRQYSSYTDADIVPIDKYTMQDLDEELDRLFDNILERQNALSASRSRNRKKSSEAAGEVKDNLLTRIPAPIAVEIALIMLGLAFVGCIPAAIFSFRFDMGKWYYLLFFIVMIVVVLVAAEIIVLLMQREELLKKIDNFNNEMENEVEELTQDIGLFSRFVSDMVSYSRGSSFKNILRRKKFALNDEYDKLKKHMRAVSYFGEKLKKWSDSFYLPVVMNREVKEDFSIDADIIPQNNDFYTFERNKEYTIPLNESGDMVTSPFEFLGMMRIEREELFDNAGSND